tara:strand:+ start:197 stop:400 length:204 start_codon:yes stop_codon:yes gene_type:complete
MVVVQEAVVIQERHPKVPNKEALIIIIIGVVDLLLHKDRHFLVLQFPQNQLRHQHPREHLTSLILNG